MQTTCKAAPYGRSGSHSNSELNSLFLILGPYDDYICKAPILKTILLVMVFILLSLLT